MFKVWFVDDDFLEDFGLNGETLDPNLLFLGGVPEIHDDQQSIGVARDVLSRFGFFFSNNLLQPFGGH